MPVGLFCIVIPVLAVTFLMRTFHQHEIWRYYIKSLYVGHHLNSDTCVSFVLLAQNRQAKDSKLRYLLHEPHSMMNLDNVTTRYLPQPEIETPEVEKHLLTMSIQKSLSLL